MAKLALPTPIILSTTEQPLFSVEVEDLLREVKGGATARPRMKESSMERSTRQWCVRHGWLTRDGDLSPKAKTAFGLGHWPPVVEMKTRPPDEKPTLRMPQASAENWRPISEPNETPTPKD